MSIHKVDVINVESYEPHPDPETIKLGIVRVMGFSVIVNKETFNAGLHFYIQPDSMVNVERPEFSFLKPRTKSKMYRVRVMKIRGFYSEGLLIPCSEVAGSEQFKEGDDAAEFLEVTHYEPPLDISGGQSCSPPRKRIIQNSLVIGEQEIHAPIYDVENYKRFERYFIEGEEVVASEKCHGSNSRFCCINGDFFAGSHYNWKKEDPNCGWWRALNNHPEVISFIKANEQFVVYAEIYGRVQNLHYGVENDIKMVIFDLLRGYEWVGWDETQEIVKLWNLPWVPLVYRGPFNKELLKAKAEEDSIMPFAPKGHIREGLVIKPVVERYEGLLGRVQLKMVSNRYLDKAKD